MALDFFIVEVHVISCIKNLGNQLIMNFIQIVGIKDSLEVNQIIETMESVTQTSTAPLTDSIIVPVIILLIFSLFKSIIAVGVKEIDVIDFLADMAIDLLSIFSSFIIGRYFLITSEPTILLKAIVIVLSMILCVALLCCLKRWANHLRGIGNFKGKLIGVIIAGEYFIDSICLLVMLKSF